MKMIKIFDIDGTLLDTDTQIYVNNIPYHHSLINKFNISDIDLKDLNDKKNIKKDFDNSVKLPLFKMLEKYGHLFKKAFITARQHEGEIERWFLRNNILGHFYAVNDAESRASCYKGMEDWNSWSTAERKAKIVQYYCKKYDIVEFYDDDVLNLEEIKNMNIDNIILYRVEETGIYLY